MWILFFIIITSPGQFKVEVLETYGLEAKTKTETPERDCKAMASSIMAEFKKTYSSGNDKDTYATVCLKQPEKEA
jgi:hypothetical protein